MKTALIISFYESNNLGDLALSYMIDQIVEQKGFKIIRYSFSGKHIQQIQNNIEIYPSSPSPQQSMRQTLQKKTNHIISKIVGDVWLENFSCNFLRKKPLPDFEQLDKDVQKSDIIVLGGGNMIMDLLPRWPNRVATFTGLAEKYHKQIFFLYIGIGPIKSKIGFQIFRKALTTATQISVRDKPSENIGKKLVVGSKITLTTDPVFALKQDIWDPTSKEVTQKQTIQKIGFCILGKTCFANLTRHKKYLDGIKKLMEALADSSHLPVEFKLFSTEGHDYKTIRDFSSLVKRLNAHTEELYNLTELIAFYGTLDFLVGGRMHSMILAHVCLLPHIGIVWQNKIHGFGQITNAETRMYTVDQLVEENRMIADKIIQTYNDKQLPIKMAAINSKLQKSVTLGNVLPND